MGEFEFRILNDDGTVAHVTSEFHLNDAIAIQYANKLAKGALFEVWRGGQRIFPASKTVGDPART